MEVTAHELIAGALRRANTPTGTSASCYDPLAHARMKARNYNSRPGDLTGVDCPRCLNRGQLMVVHKDGTTAIEVCDCMTVRDSLKRIERSGMKSLVSRYTLESYTTGEPWQKAAKDLAQEYASDPAGHWLTLNGQPGCGKTHLCTAVCNELMHKGMETRYVLWRDTVRRLKASVNDADSYDKTMEDLKRVKLLYIDDFLKVGGGERPREGDLNVAFELLNARYSNPKLLTIISTERTPQEIMGFDEAIASRINERCGKFRLTFEGEQKNQRKRIAGRTETPTESLLTAGV